MACILMRANPMESRGHCDEFEGHVDLRHDANSSRTRLSSALIAVVLRAVLCTYTNSVADPSSMIRLGERMNDFPSYGSSCFVGSPTQLNGNILRASMILSW